MNKTKINLIQSGVLFLTIITMVIAQTPNYVKTTTYAENPTDQNSTQLPSESIVYSDGFGRTIQSQSKINSSSTYSHIISQTGYDELGRPCSTYLSVPVNITEGTIVDDYLTTLNNYYNGVDITDANGNVLEEHPNAGGVPFAKTEYDEKGMPHATYPVGVPYSNYPTRVWTIGVTPETNGGFYKYWYTSEGFAVLYDKATSAAHLDALIKLPKTSQADPTDGTSVSNYASPTHMLTISMSADGVFSQQITDALGRVVKTGAICVGTTINTSFLKVVSKYRYDIVGNLLEETAPKDDAGNELVGNSSTLYNTLGEVLQRTAPDAGTVECEYDDAGRMIAYVDGNLRFQSQQGYTPKIVITYDKLGRKTLVRKVWINDADKTDTSSIYRLQKFIYDFPSELSEHIVGNTLLESLITSDVVAQMTETYGKLVAEIQYWQYNTDKQIIKFYSYDNKGRIWKKWMSIPQHSKLHSWEYEFNKGGNILSEKYYNGSQTIVTRTVYDKDGNVDYIERNGEKKVAYQYNPHGGILRKSYYDGSGTNEILTKEFDAKITGQMEKQVVKTNAGGEIFSQILTYNDQNGMITTNKLNQNNNTMDLNYTYDNLNRLSTVTPINGTDAKYGAGYIYDNAGRITTKHEFWQQGAWTYNYGQKASNAQTQSNSKLTSIGGLSNRNRVDNKDNYLYDHNGNMVLDRSKNMIINYDYRNLPVRFMFFSPGEISQIPGFDASGNANLTLSYMRVHFSVSNALSYVEMAYDVGGNRVAKQVYKKN